jgi:hypothetical protein
VGKKKFKNLARLKNCKKKLAPTKSMGREYSKWATNCTSEHRMPV